MTPETELEKPKPQPVPLTNEQLLEIWKKDPYWGKTGSYQTDPFTGKRTPK